LLSSWSLWTTSSSSLAGHRKLGMISAESLIDITGTKLIDLLTIEQEAH